MEARMTEAHKLRIKIGDAEFEASGTEETVKAQFEAFLAAVGAGAGKTSTPKSQETPPGDKNGEQLSGGAGADDDLLLQAVVVGKDLVSLKYLPKGDNRDADALLLLLYAYSKLRKEDSVLGTQLLRAAKVSGLSLERVDRTMAKHESYILKGGARKGMKYSLNNQGKAKAQELLKQMLTA
jgi:hypothetical protein